MHTVCTSMIVHAALYYSRLQGKPQSILHGVLTLLRTTLVRTVATRCRSPEAASCPLLGTRSAKPVLIGRLARFALACRVASSRSNLRASSAASSFGRGNTCTHSQRRVALAAEPLTWHMTHSHCLITINQCRPHTSTQICIDLQQPKTSDSQGHRGPRSQRSGVLA